MTAKCANPSCCEPFVYFRTGRIFLIDVPGMNSPTGITPRRGPEYFWLCGECCRTMRVVLDRSGAVAIEKDAVIEAVA